MLVKLFKKLWSLMNWNLMVEHIQVCHINGGDGVGSVRRIINGSY